MLVEMETSSTMPMSDNIVYDAESKAKAETGSVNSASLSPTTTTRRDQENAPVQEQGEEDEEGENEEASGSGALVLTGLPEIPTAGDLNLDFFSFMQPSDEREAKVNKRASNVMKLTQEKEELQAQLKAMGERLEAMERLRAAKEQKRMS